MTVPFQPKNDQAEKLPGKLRLRPRQRRGYSPGQWQVQRERNRIADSQPPLVFAEAVSLGTAVRELVRHLEAAEQSPEAALRARWSELVGASLARRTRPGGLANGVLTVFVENAVWLHEVKRNHLGAMLRGIQNGAGKCGVTGIALRPDPEAGAPRPPAGR